MFIIKHMIIKEIMCLNILFLAIKYMNLFLTEEKENIVEDFNNQVLIILLVGKPCRGIVYDIFIKFLITFCHYYLVMVRVRECIGNIVILYQIYFFQHHEVLHFFNGKLEFQFQHHEVLHFFNGKLEFQFYWG